MNPIFLKSGKLIVFEGLDGIGKSTQIQKLSDYFTQNHIAHFLTREPGGTPLGQTLRTLLKTYDFKSLRAELCLIFAARAEHFEAVIAPALKAGKIVLCDRFIDSTFAYQGGGQQIPESDIRVLEQLILKDFEPDLVILLDAPVDVCLQRLSERDKSLDRLEQIGQDSVDFFQRIRDSYIKRAARQTTRTIYNIMPITADQTIDQIFQKIQTVIQDFLNKN